MPDDEQESAMIKIATVFTLCVVGIYIFMILSK
jgi:hypothetical protein